MFEKAEAPPRHDPSAHPKGVGADPARPQSVRHLATGFSALVALTTGLIVLGALVRANQAGLACPDWPLCFGEVLPRLNLEVGFEWTHRVVAGSVTAIFLALGVLLLRRSDSPRAARMLLAVAAGLLATQILLGALTVWLLLASWTVTAHLIVGNGFSLTLLLIACSLRDSLRDHPARPPVAAKVRGAVLASAALLGLQIVLGGLVSSQYAGLACPEWPTCKGGVWIPAFRGSVGLHLLHRMNGYALLVALAAAAALSRREPGLRWLTALALALGGSGVLVGIINVRLGIPAEITGLHSAIAAALVLTLTLAVRNLFTRSARAA